MERLRRSLTAESKKVVGQVWLQKFRRSSTNHSQQREHHAPHRKPLATKLDRKLQAVDESSDDLSYYEVSDRSSPSIVETGEGDPIEDSESDEDEEHDHDEQEVQLSCIFMRHNLIEF